MSDPKQTQRETDQFDLEAETVKDLELGENMAWDLRGGVSVGGPLPGGTSHKPV